MIITLDKNKIPDFYKTFDSSQTREYNYFIDSIRNMRKLNKSQIKYLDSLNILELKQIIKEYDKVVDSFNTILDNINN